MPRNRGCGAGPLAIILVVERVRERCFTTSVFIGWIFSYFILLSFLQVSDARLEQPAVTLTNKSPFLAGNGALTRHFAGNIAMIVPKFHQAFHPTNVVF